MISANRICLVGTVAAAPPASSPAPTPSWGKIVDPRRQGRWQLLRCVQDGGGDGGVGQVGRGRGNPTAWARRSYSVGYMPVFQDSRAPGEYRGRRGDPSFKVWLGLGLRRCNFLLCVKIAAFGRFDCAVFFRSSVVGGQVDDLFRAYNIFLVVLSWQILVTLHHIYQQR